MRHLLEEAFSNLMEAQTSRLSLGGLAKRIKKTAKENGDKKLASHAGDISAAVEDMGGSDTQKVGSSIKSGKTHEELAAHHDREVEEGGHDHDLHQVAADMHRHAINNPHASEHAHHLTDILNAVPRDD